jgi:hypothetical protein
MVAEPVMSISCRSFHRPICFCRSGGFSIIDIMNFVPPVPQRELRELTRYHSSFIAERATLSNRLAELGYEDTLNPKQVPLAA